MRSIASVFMSSLRSDSIVLALCAALACTGPAGPPGPPGPSTAPDGGASAPTTSIAYGAMTAQELQDSKMVMEITSVTIPADGRPVVNMKITERHGSGVKGIPVSGNVTWRFAMLKLATGVNGSVNTSWVSYMAPNDHSASNTESASAANFTDNGDGTYVYRFAQNVTAGVNGAGTSYDPASVHRLAVLLSESNTAFTPINLVKEFVPLTGADVTGQNDKVDQNACLECHTTFRGIAGATGDLGDGQFHGGSRFDVRTCVSCHNDQRKFKFTQSTGPDFPTLAADATWSGDLQVVNSETVMNFPVFVHRIHMGQRATLTGGTYAGYERPYNVTFPQDVRNCVKCHQAPAALADNYKNQPSRRACGACHDDISFASPAPPGRRVHTGGAQANDGNCLLCHSAGAPAGDIPSSHVPVSPPNPNNIYNPAATAPTGNTNAAWVAAVGAVPAGASVVTYEVKSASTWIDASVTPNVTRPQIVFRILLDSAAVIFPVPNGTNELIPNFVGGPSAYFVFAVPEDNKTTPADFNATGSAYIRNIWNNTGTCSNVPATATTTPTGAGILSAPDTAGFYTLQLTCVIVDPNAKMLTGGIGYTYSLGSAQIAPVPNFVNHNQPFTQINMPKYPYTPNDPANPGRSGGQGGLVVPAPDKSIAATGFSPRRAVVATTKCQGCHESLGVGPDFHAGQRNESATCNWCHNPNQNRSGWAGNEKDMVHSIHGAEKRGVHFTWHQVSPTDGYWLTTYPAILNICTMCHLDGTFDFSTSDAQAALPNMLVSTTTTGTVATPPAAGTSPYAPPGAYGAGFSYNALTGVTTQGAATNLVTTPIMAACSACHDSTSAIDHMQTNGGQFWVTRSSVPANPQGEQCLVCHGPNRIAAIALVHTIKAP
jgi:OmcA/MtrC family decaheme c-type cytochrome